MIKLYPTIDLPGPPQYLRNKNNYITVDELRKDLSSLKKKINRKNIPFNKTNVEGNKLTLQRKVRYLANVLEPTVLRFKINSFSKLSRKPKHILNKTARIILKDNSFKLRYLEGMLQEALTDFIKINSKNKKLLRFNIFINSLQPNYNEYIVNVRFDRDSMSLKKILKTFPTKLQCINGILRNTKLNPSVYSQLLRLKGLDQNAAKEITKMWIDPSYYGR